MRHARSIPLYLILFTACGGDDASPTSDASATDSVTDSSSIETTADTAPADTAPADTAPADTAPADTAPADTAPADTAPADTAPDASIDTAPGDTSEPDPTVPVQTEFDSIAAAPKCKDVDDGTNCVEPVANAVRIDDELRLGWKRADFDKENQIIRIELEAGATLDPRLVEGAFIYRGRKDKDAMMHRIKTLKIEGNRVGIEVAQAKAKDVFRRGRIRARIPLADPATPAVPNAVIQATIGPADCTGSGPIIDGHFSVPFLGEGDVTLELTECRFRLTAWVDAVLLWDSGIANLDKVEVVVGGSIDAALHAELTVDVDGFIGGSTTLWQSPPILFTVGGIVITATPKLIAGYSVNAAATLSIEAGFDYFGSKEVGFGWSDRLKWYTINTNENEFTAFGPDVYFDGAIGIRVYVKPRIDLLAFGIIGGYVALETFADAGLTSTARLGANGNYNGEVCADLTVGITPSVGATAEIIGITLFDEELELFTWDIDLVEDACFDWSGPAPSNCDPTGPCCVDGECPANADPEITVTCEPGPAGIGLQKYTCEEHFPDDYCTVATADEACADGRALTVDSCVDNRCVNNPPGPDEALLAQPVVDVEFANTCIRPIGCCYTASDCADGNIRTFDTCLKALFAGPDVKGTCTHRIL